MAALQDLVVNLQMPAKDLQMPATDLQKPALKPKEGGNGDHILPIISQPNNQDKQIEKDLKAILEAKMELNEIRQEIKKLALALSSMSNPMLGMQEIMIDVMGESGAQVTGLSKVDNLDSDLRNEVNGAESAVNSIGKGGKGSIEDAQKLLDYVNQLKTFIKTQEAEGKNSTVNQSALKSLSGALNQIESQFPKGSWGNPVKMKADVTAWVNSSKYYGKYAPQLKNIQDGLQTANQTTSALSTTTNTMLKFKSEQFKQFMGVAQSVDQSWLKLTLAFVTNQKSQ